MLVHESIWKYDYVYELFDKDDRFEPVVVICPDTVNGKERILDDMQSAFNTFIRNGYNTISSYDKANREWLNIKTLVHPDIVFFTNPHKITRPEYCISNFYDCLTCYVPYAFVIIRSLNLHYNQVFQNVLWKAFYETSFHEAFSRNLAANGGTNVEVTGYPGIDKLIDPNYSIKADPWKIKDPDIKRIIWAPHHSIHGDGSDLDYSNFLTYAFLMLEIADKYSKTIQIAFKPHPLLKSKLMKNREWGEQRTLDYYESWSTRPNGLLNESSYTDLFLTSDAMIHDSASFMVEYLYIGKPVLFTKRDSKIRERFNDFGKIVFNHLYQADNESEILTFIDEVVLNNKDTMKEQRMQFVVNNLLPPNNRLASENIYHIIKNEIAQNEG